MDTEVVTLSSRSRGILLKESSRHVIQRQEEAETLLHRLHQLNSDVAAQFQLKKSVLSRLTLRMICSSDADILRDPNSGVPSYLAVSYCWYNSSWATVKAAQPTTKWGISLPMATKILELRNSKDEGIWVDKICIDQENAEEKKFAIGSMDIIYHACRRLVIVLEDIQLTKTEEAIGSKYSALFEEMCLRVRRDNLSGPKKSDFVDSFWHIEASDVLAVEKFCIEMLGARWYSRAWCAHEARMSVHGFINPPIFLCFGADGIVLSFEFRYIYFLATSVSRQKSRTAYPSEWDDPSVLIDPNCPTLFQRMMRIDRLAPRADNPQTSLLYDLNTISNFGCQEVTDLYAIAMNTAKVPLVFTGSLKSRNDIYYISALIAIASGDISPLFIQSRPLELQMSGAKTYICWAGQPYAVFSTPHFTTPFSESIKHVTGEYIELDILLIKAKPQKISEESMQKASNLFEKYSPRKQQTQRIGEPSHTDLLLEKAVTIMNKAPVDYAWSQSLLGSAIECGIDWIRRFPDVLDKEATEGRWDHGTFKDFNPDFTNAAMDLLSYFGITTITSPAFDDEFLRPTIRFFSCIFDDRLRLLSMVPRRIQTKASGDFALTQRVSHRSWIAVPQAISHLPFFIDKAWVIEPYDPAAPEQVSVDSYAENALPTDLESWADFFPLLDSDFPDRRSPPNALAAWQMRRKQPLYGCQPIVEDGEAVILLKNQKIYGGRDYDWAAEMKKMSEWGIAPKETGRERSSA